MKTLTAIAALALLLASCKTRNESSSLPILKVVAPTAAASGSGTTTTLTCKFDPGAPEFSQLPYNPAENHGNVAAVVQNQLSGTTQLSPLLRTDTTTFLPHQAVVDYEIIPSTAGKGPAENVIPVGGSVQGGQLATVGVNVFSGLSSPISVPDGTYIRVTFHIEGKLLDGSEVRTSEREYLFRFCSAAGCGTGGPWAAQVGTASASCL